MAWWNILFGGAADLVKAATPRAARHQQRIENKAEKQRRLDAGCFPSASIMR